MQWRAEPYAPIYYLSLPIQKRNIEIQTSSHEHPNTLSCINPVASVYEGGATYSPFCPAHVP